MGDLIVAVGRPAVEVILGENTDEARRQALLAEEAAQQMSRIATAEGRSALYGITDRAMAQAFGAYGVELDFAAGFYRSGHAIAATPGDLPGWSFNRDSAATWQVGAAVQNFADDAPRIIAGTGLAIEPSAQNLLLRSREFDHAVWDKISAGAGLAPVVVANDAAAPDGTMTADKITLNLNGGTSIGDRSHLQQDLATTLGAQYGGSIFVKGVAGEKIVLRHVAGGSYLLHVFDGTWQRIALVEAAAGTSGTFEFGLRGGLGASGAVTFHAWGAQFEAGSVVTSYIATGEFSGTRDEDSAILGDLTLGASTVLVEATLTSGASDTDVGRRAFAALYAGSGADNIVSIVNSDAGAIGGVVEAGGVVAGSSSTAAVAAKGEAMSIAMRIAEDDSRLMRNAVGGRWIFDGAAPDILTTLHIGGSPLSALARLGGTVRRIVVFPFALADSGLAVLTGGSPEPEATATWTRIAKNGGFPHRDSAKTFRLGGYQYLAGGYSADGDRHDLRRSLDGTDFSEIVNADPAYDDYSQVIALDGKIYAWSAKMFVSTDAGATFTEILAALPWGISGYDNRAIVHDGKLLFFHGTGDASSGFEGVWQFDPAFVDPEDAWTLILPEPWSPRNSSAVGEFAGKLYLYGGYRNAPNVPPETTYPGMTTLNDLWEIEFVAGVPTATRIVDDMPIAPRAWPALIANGDRLYLIGGYDNIGPVGRNYDQTLVSADGRAWTLLPVKRALLQRHAPTAYVANGMLFLAAGNGNAAAPTLTLQDIWRLDPEP